MREYHYSFCEEWTYPKNTDMDKVERVLDKHAQMYAMNFSWDAYFDKVVFTSSTDTGNDSPDGVAECVARLQRLYKDRRPWLMTYSINCVRPDEPGGFSGAGFIVREGKVEELGRDMVRLRDETADKIREAKENSKCLLKRKVKLRL